MFIIEQSVLKCVSVRAYVCVCVYMYVCVHECTYVHVCVSCSINLFHIKEAHCSLLPVDY